MTLQPPPLMQSTAFDPKSSIHKPGNSLAHKHLSSTRHSQSQVENPQNFADLRLKLGEKKKDLDDQESLPSELSDDEWVEIVKYQKEQYDEEQRREQEKFLHKKQQLREVLDKQLRD